MNRKFVVLIEILIIVSLSISATADVYWKGSTSANWSVATNWTGGLPSTPGSGSAVVNPGNPFQIPVVSNLGNTTTGELYISIGASLSVVSGGQLSIASNLITGIWGNSAAVTVSGGELNMGSYLNLGAGGYDGNILISGGTVTARYLAINTTRGAGMDISGAGRFITNLDQLGNINYWVTHDVITANGGAYGSIAIDTVTDPGKVILTASATSELCDGTTGPIPGDISGPGGVPDCHVDIYDVAALAKDWLTCSLVPQTACWQ